MMPPETYITAAQLCQVPGAVELVQVLAQDGEYPVPAPLLTLLANAAPTEAWSPEDVAMTTATLTRLQAVIDDTQTVIDGYLRQRGLALPLKTQPRQLTAWARDIARYQLHRYRLGNESTDPIVRDYKTALGFLQKVADGRYALGLDDPLPAQGGKAKHAGPPRTFNMGTLRHFGK
ncbi:phage protein Gp36 family protein [Providencia rettgeri]